MTIRCLVAWVPDWPVRSAGASFDEPAATVAAKRISSCTAAARAEGVRRGQRVRDAQALCPELTLLPADSLRETKAFDEVLRLLARLVPGVHQIRPGACAFRMRGAARYYGDEERAAQRIFEALRGADFPDARVGVAEGVFAAEQAARHALPILIVPEGETKSFLAPFPVSALDDPDMTRFFTRLGVHTLGDLAALDPDAMQGRLGPAGARFHAIARGEDPSRLRFEEPPRELSCEQSFEPPLFVVDQIAFGVRRMAEAFVDGLGQEGLLCTELRVNVDREDGEQHERVWGHPRAFEASDIVDRVRWQIHAWHNGGAAAERQYDVPPGITRVRLSPHRTDSAAGHQPSLLGQGADSRVHHALSRVQSMLGHEGVLIPHVHGGRSPREREQMLPWGEALPRESTAMLPWPGALPSPLPTTVFPELPPLDVLSEQGQNITIDEDDTPSAAPAMLSFGVARRRIVAWTGPWLSAEGLEGDGTIFRFQLLDDMAGAWLVRCDGEQWALEGRYD